MCLFSLVSLQSHQILIYLHIFFSTRPIHPQLLLYIPLIDAALPSSSDPSIPSAYSVDFARPPPPHLIRRWPMSRYTYLRRGRRQREGVDERRGRRRPRAVVSPSLRLDGSSLTDRSSGSPPPGRTTEMQGIALVDGQTRCVGVRSPEPAGPTWAMGPSPSKI
jgi:hypothetical protein